MLKPYKPKEIIPVGGVVLVLVLTLVAFLMIYAVDRAPPIFFRGPSFVFLLAVFPMTWGFYALARRRFRTRPTLIRLGVVYFVMGVWAASHVGVYHMYMRHVAKSIDRVSPQSRFRDMEKLLDSERTLEQEALIERVNERRERDWAEYWRHGGSYEPKLTPEEVEELEEVYTAYLDFMDRVSTPIGYLRLRALDDIRFGSEHYPFLPSNEEANPSTLAWISLALGWGFEIFVAIFVIRAFAGRLLSRPFAREASKPYLLLDLGPVKNLSASKAREAIQANDPALLTFPDEMLDPDDSDEIRVQIAEETHQGDPPLLRFNRLRGVGKKGDLKLEALSPWFEVTPKEVEAIRTRLRDLKRSKQDDDEE